MSTVSRVITHIPRPLVENNRIVFLESILALAVAWYLFAHGLNIVDLASSPEIVVMQTIELVLQSDDWYVHVFATMRRIFYALVATMIIGTALGLLMGWYDFWEVAFKDWIIIGLALPSLVAAVFAAMWFGFSPFTPTVAAALIGFPFITEQLYEGTNNLDYKIIDMSKSFDVPRWQVLYHAVFKGILPYWFSGLRYAFAGSWKITVLAETIVASTGMGYQIQWAMSTLNLEGLLKWTLLFMVIIMFVEYGIFQQVEKRVFEWRQETTIGFAT